MAHMKTQTCRAQYVSCHASASPAQLIMCSGTQHSMKWSPQIANVHLLVHLLSHYSLPSYSSASRFEITGWASLVPRVGPGTQDGARYPGWGLVPRVGPGTQGGAWYPGWGLVPRVGPGTQGGAWYPGWGLVPRMG